MSQRSPAGMIALGYGTYVRADRIVMLEPLRDGEGRGGGARTRVWVEGVVDAVIASRTERAILADMDDGSTQARRGRRRTPRGQAELF